ncbi:histone H1-like [Thalassophryne amazonica]|uniref:histone H1-like n=1 Tax=Thalassophryne amazonica TaxID=390379 RepID=UPI001471D968|nr:histone H1-like [Thalassophryne amazonica]
MAEEAPAAAALAKALKKKPAKAKKVGPSVSDLIVQTVTASKERKGVSLAALKNALAAGGYDVKKNNAHVKVAVKSLVSKGKLVQTKGSGASGSFKLGIDTKSKPAAKKSAPKAKKAAVKKPKKVAATKRPPASKKSPKKVKKPVAAKKSP